MYKKVKQKQKTKELIFSVKKLYYPLKSGKSHFRFKEKGGFSPPLNDYFSFFYYSLKAVSIPANFFLSLGFSILPVGLRGTSSK